MSKSLRRSQIEAMLACEGGRRNSTILDLDSLDSTRFSEVAESKNLPESSNTSSTGQIAVSLALSEPSQYRTNSNNGCYYFVSGFCRDFGE